MIIMIISIQKVLGIRSELDTVRYLDDIESTNVFNETGL